VKADHSRYEQQQLEMPGHQQSKVRGRTIGDDNEADDVNQSSSSGGVHQREGQELVHVDICVQGRPA